jgi:hypothetical protein
LRRCGELVEGRTPTVRWRVGERVRARMEPADGRPRLLVGQRAPSEYIHAIVRPRGRLMGLPPSTWRARRARAGVRQGNLIRRGPGRAPRRGAQRARSRIRVGLARAASEAESEQCRRDTCAVGGGLGAEPRSPGAMVGGAGARVGQPAHRSSATGREVEGHDCQSLCCRRGPAGADVRLGVGNDDTAVRLAIEVC